MSRVNVTTDNPNEGKTVTVCTQQLIQRYAGVYEVQSNGKTLWWTHGVSQDSKVYDDGACQRIQVGTNPIGGTPIYASWPPPHPPNALDYIGSNNNRHYFLGYGATAPTKRLLVSG